MLESGAGGQTRLGNFRSKGKSIMSLTNNIIIARSIYSSQSIAAPVFSTLLLMWVSVGLTRNELLFPCHLMDFWPIDLSYYGNSKGTVFSHWPKTIIIIVASI